MGVRPNFGEVRTPRPPSGCAHGMNQRDPCVHGGAVTLAFFSYVVNNNFMNSLNTDYRDYYLIIFYTIHFKAIVTAMRVLFVLCHQ